MHKDVKYCFWSNGNCAAEKYLCCHSCKVKNCDFRCLDDYESCIYKGSIDDTVDKPLYIEKQAPEKPKPSKFLITRFLRDKLRHMKESNRFTIADISKRSGVQGYIIQKCLAKNIDILVTEDQYNKLNDFLNE